MNAPGWDGIAIFTLIIDPMMAHEHFIAEPRRECSFSDALMLGLPGTSGCHNPCRYRCMAGRSSEGRLLSVSGI